jgi:hypothetical protein
VHANPSSGVESQSSSKPLQTSAGGVHVVGSVHVSVQIRVPTVPHPLAQGEAVPRAHAKPSSSMPSQSSSIPLQLSVLVALQAPNEPAVHVSTPAAPHAFIHGRVTPSSTSPLQSSSTLSQSSTPSATQPASNGPASNGPASNGPASTPPSAPASSSGPPSKPPASTPASIPASDITPASPASTIRPPPSRPASRPSPSVNPERSRKHPGRARTSATMMRGTRLDMAATFRRSVEAPAMIHERP